jgi:hypothetical protein
MFRLLNTRSYRAAMWEHGHKDTETWDVHACIYFFDGPFSMVLHDNQNSCAIFVNAY